MDIYVNNPRLLILQMSDICKDCIFNKICNEDKMEDCEKFNELFEKSLVKTKCTMVTQKLYLRGVL